MLLRRIEKIVRHFSSRHAFTILLIIISIHLIAMVFFMNDNRSAHRAEMRDAVIQKIVNVINLIYATPVENRSKAILAHADPYLDASITEKPLWPLQFSSVSYWQINQALHRQLELFSISIQVESQQWLNIHATIYSHFFMTQFIYFIVEVLIFSIVLIAMWMIGRYTKPFRSFTEMAERLGVDLASELLPIDGPSVVREAYEAMNRMQSRIQELIRDRTQMLAAISHDLRTPITRMKLRLQFMEEEISQHFLVDLEEMETMMNETMVFARDDVTAEGSVQVDVVSLVLSICNSMVDMGHDVCFKTRSNRVAVMGKPVALKRAINNLIHNAVRYAKQVDVKVYCRDEKVIVLVKDDGPGISEKELERVFAPFYRGEHSRSRDTGGVGLGLAVTRDIIKAHGGQVTLRNRVQGGLYATVELPFLMQAVCPIKSKACLT